MNNIIRRHTKPAYNRCASTGYRPAKMPFGYDQADPRCIEFIARLKGTIEALIDEGYRCRSRHRSAASMESYPVFFSPFMPYCNAKQRAVRLP